MVPAVAVAAAGTRMSERVRRFVERAEEGGGVLGLERAERAFDAMKRGLGTVPNLVSVGEDDWGGGAAYDVCVVGGTLGLFYAAALQKLGWDVCVVERGVVRGRSQEWNASRAELDVFLKTGLLTAEELEHVIVTEFEKGGRVGFVGKGGEERVLRVKGVLNVGVAPDRLIEILRRRFVEDGGRILENRALESVRVDPCGVRVGTRPQSRLLVKGALGAGGAGVAAGAEDGAGVDTITTRLLVDGMGAFSPIAAQANGGRRRPDGVCITVGSCMRGNWPANDDGDLIYAFRGIEQSSQNFWEAFPAASLQRGEAETAHTDEGESAAVSNLRTTYRFSYGGCTAERETLFDALDSYLEQLPEYQGVDLESMDVLRVLFGFFPCYRDSPSRIAFDRIFPIGDAAGLQSPISFGGFGSTLRHLTRITDALHESLSADDDSLLYRGELQRIQAYLPSLSCTWLFNKAMSVRPGQATAGPLLDEYGINDLLWSNMKAMERLGEKVQLPFLQDVVKADGLSKTLLAMATSNPVLAVKLTGFLGPGALLDWSRHYFALLAYAAALPVARAIQPRLLAADWLGARGKFRFNRLVDSLTYGSGADHS